ncbi:MAG: hypothetical protein AAF723_04315, partial [Pseudomonadota bacterium]
MTILEKLPSGTIKQCVIVDIGNAKNRHDVMKIISKTMRGHSYGSDINRNRYPENLDAFTEYVEDWYDMVWGETICVRFLNSEDFIQKFPKDFLGIISAIHEAEINSLYE